MSDFTLEIQIGLAIVLGLDAIVLSFLIWRGPDIATIKSELLMLSQNAALSLSPKETHYYQLKLIVQLILLVTGVLFSLITFWETYHYLEIVHDLVNKSHNSDLAYFFRLQLHAEATKDSAMNIGFITILFFCTSWLLELLPYPSNFNFTEIKKLPLLHEFIYITQNEPFEVLWNRRIKESKQYLPIDLLQEYENAVDLLEAASNNWVIWAMCVDSYRKYIASNKQDQLN